MAEAVVVSACRTPIGKFQGGLSSFRAPELGAIAIREALRRASVDGKDVEEVVFGTVLQAGLGQNPARQAALGAGLPPEVPAVTINKVCGSGLKAVMLAAQAIRAGDAHVIVAGGQESMSRAPYLSLEARNGLRLGHGKLVDAMVHDGLWDVYNDFHMGATGDLVRVEKDEGVRADTTLEALAKMKPAFGEKGTVTAANASQISDGASALVVMSDVEAKKRGLSPLARITGYAAGGTEPKWVMLAPVYAVRNLERRTGTKTGSYDLVELNEAFSSAACGVTKELGIDLARTNVHGGAVALGHPIGASGARILTTLLYAMRRRDAKRGLAALCLGGGNAVALSVER
jgi:acetyl-CoA C-acetyltransferase